MPPFTGGREATKESELSALRRAISVERRARYADFQGRRSTFSQFMRQTADRLNKRYPLDSVWVTIRALFRQYPNTDVGTRISIVKRAEELLIPFWEAAELQTEGTDMLLRSETSAGGDTREKAPQANIQQEQQQNEVWLLGAESIPRVRTEHHPESRTQSPSVRGTSPSVGGTPCVPSGQHDLALTRQITDPRHTKPTKERESRLVVPRTSQSELGQSRLDQIKPIELSQVSVQYVRGVGPKVANVLARLNINTVEDLLRHYPRRHLDFQNRLYIKQLQVGQEVTIFGMIRTVSAFQSRKGNVSIINIVITDGTGSLTITRFIGGKSNKYLLDRYKEQFPKGAHVLTSGIVEKDQFTHRLTLKNAEIELLGYLAGDGDNEDQSDLQAMSLHVGRIVPVYPLTEGIGLRYLRNIIHNALEGYRDYLHDPIPKEIRKSLGLIDLRTAIEFIHFPQDPDSKDNARHRLVFDELFAVQLQLALRRHKFDQTEGALSLKLNSDGLVKRLCNSLPFKLTSAQERVFSEIAHDLSSAKPMHRLVQGDVGSGKTIVALMAFLVAIENGYQGVMMAPTEILAEQHYWQFQKFLTPLGLRSALVVGKQGQRERRHIRQELLSGQIHIAIGTHALLEEDVEFQNLGLIIIDEQHRFGVKQRARLKAKSQSPELLTMTATPIPRTMALTIHGDLDVSEIDELPPGRKPVKTELIRPSQKKDLWRMVRDEIDKGRQGYVVFPLIEESETLSAKAATQEYEKLQKEKQFEGLKIGLMHGKLKPQEKDEAMDKFRDGFYQLLVCTTVIEVGVDVSNATVMVIENADRFGLAQLHQLRGRVGRGSDQSYCFLISELKSPQSRERLEIMTQTNDGFVIAEKDLELRGPGEFLGYRQSGLPDLLLADLVKDTLILEKARNAAISIVREDPELSKYSSLKRMIERQSNSFTSEVLRSG